MGCAGCACGCDSGVSFCSAKPAGSAPGLRLCWLSNFKAFLVLFLFNVIFWAKRYEFILLCLILIRWGKREAMCGDSQHFIGERGTAWI